VTACYPDTEPLAHSANKQNKAQTYRAHLLGDSDQGTPGVIPVVTNNIKQASQNHPDENFRMILEKVLYTIAEYHDLGKLLPENQDALKKGTCKKLPLDHVDAGAALFLKERLLEPTLSIYSHHRGLSRSAS